MGQKKGRGDNDYDIVMRKLKIKQIKHSLQNKTLGFSI